MPISACGVQITSAKRDFSAAPYAPNSTVAVSVVDRLVDLNRELMAGLPTIPVSHARDERLIASMTGTNRFAVAVDSVLQRLTFCVLVLAAVSAFRFGAIVTAAFAAYHVTCVGHGFVHGDSLTDESFFSRVEAGCGTGTKTRDIYTYGTLRAGVVVSGSSTCNAWSNNYGSYTERVGSAHVEYVGVFSRHAHKATARIVETAVRASLTVDGLRAKAARNFDVSSVPVPPSRSRRAAAHIEASIVSIRLSSGFRQ